MSAPLPEVKGENSSLDMAGREPPLVFLVYLNRSGSTLLASHLAQYAGLVVTLESEAIGRLLLSSRQVYSREQREECLQKLFAEPKFQQWGIEQDRLRRAVAEAPLPLSRQRFLRIVLSLLPGGDTARCYIIKAPRMLESLSSAEEVLQGCKLLHIYRDPRSVYASQRGAISSRTGQPMVRDAVTAGLRWRHAIQLVKQSKLPRLEIRFEDFVADQSEPLQQLQQFLELEAMKEQEEVTRYVDRIPAPQRHLHTNVARPPDLSRIDSWQDKLTAGEVWLLERACGEQLRLCGYTPQRELGRAPGVAEVVCASLRHGGYWARDIVRRIAHRISS